MNFTYKKRKLNNDNNNNDDNNNIILPSDSEVALELIKKKFKFSFYKEIKGITAPLITSPIILQHQLYYLIKNRSEVDTVVVKLSRKNKIRIFRFLSTEISNATALIYTEDYVNEILKLSYNNKEEEYILKQFTNVVLPNIVAPYISKKDLIHYIYYNEENKVRKREMKDEDAISYLIKSSLLLRRGGPEQFSFTFPKAGVFLQHLQNGRKELISIIKRSRYNELKESVLLQKKLKKTKLPMNYLIQDSVGANLLDKIKTSEGYYIRYRPLDLDK